MAESNPSRSFVSILWPAFVAGLVGAAASLIGSSFTGLTLFADLVTEASTFFLGPRGFSFLLNQLGPNGKPLLFFGVITGQFVIYAGVSFLLSRRAAVAEASPHSAGVPPFWLQSALVTTVFIGISLFLTSFGEAVL